MKKLLFGADDSKINRTIIEEAAKFLDMDTVVAEDGKIALDKLNELIKSGRKPDIIFTDIHMPNMNGLDFMKAVKAIEAVKYIPIIVLTTETALEPKMLAKDMGAAGWIIKPMSPEDVAKVVKKFLSK